MAELNVFQKAILKVPFIANTVSETVTKTSMQVVNQTIQDVKAEAVAEYKEELRKAQDSQPRNFALASSNSGEGINAKKESSIKNYDTLYTLHSDAPGSIQASNRTAEAIISTGYVIEKDGNGGTKADLKRLIKFFDQPNPDDTIETLVQSGLRNYLAFGDWYMETVPTKDGKSVAEMYLLDTTEMSILVDAELKKRGLLKKMGYVRSSLGKEIGYNLDEVIHIKRPSQKAGLYGKAVLEDNGPILTLALKALSYNINILKNGGRPPIQLVLPEDSTENDAQAVSAFYEKNFMGVGNAGKALVSFKGAKAEALGISAQDMAYLELLNLTIRLVAGQYGVPLMLIGIPEGSNRSTASEARRAFYYSNIYPLRKVITNKITQDIIKNKMGIEGWKFNFRGAGLEESDSAKRDTMSAWSQGLMNFNETRSKLGMLPIDNKWAEQFYLLGSKNDSLIPIEEAIGRVSDTSAPDATKPMNKPTAIDQGQGADANGQ